MNITQSAGLKARGSRFRVPLAHPSSFTLHSSRHGPLVRGSEPPSPLTLSFCPMSLESLDAEVKRAPRPSSCPGGTSDNSPTFQRWVGAPEMSRVPKGRLSGGPMSAVPSGFVGLCMAKPDVKTLGYYHSSLRDEHETLVALPPLPPLHSPILTKYNLSPRQPGGRRRPPPGNVNRNCSGGAHIVLGAFGLKKGRHVPPHPCPLPRERGNLRQSVDETNRSGIDDCRPPLFPLPGERVRVRGA
jgi:hypothetical protein